MQIVLKITLNTLPAPRTHALDVPRYSKMPLPQPLNQEEEDFGSRFSNLRWTPTSPTLLGTWNTGTYWFLPCLGTESKHVKGYTEEIRLCWWWLCGRHCTRQNEPLQEGTMTLVLFPYGDILSCVEEESDHTNNDHFPHHQAKPTPSTSFFSNFVSQWTSGSHRYSKDSSYVWK